MPGLTSSASPLGAYEFAAAALLLLCALSGAVLLLMSYRTGEAGEQNQAFVPLVATDSAMPPAPFLLVEVTESVGVYLGPGSSFPVVGGLETGESVLAVGRTEDASWIQLSVAPFGTEVWAPASRLTSDKPLTGLPIIELPPEQQTCVIVSHLELDGPVRIFPGSHHEVTIVLTVTTPEGTPIPDAPVTLSGLSSDGTDIAFGGLLFATTNGAGQVSIIMRTTAPGLNTLNLLDIDVPGCTWDVGASDDGIEWSSS